MDVNKRTQYQEHAESNERIPEGLVIKQLIVSISFVISHFPSRRELWVLLA